MNAIKEIIIHKCVCSQSPATGEWDTEVHIEFMLKNPQRFNIFGKEYCIDRIILETDDWGIYGHSLYINDFCGISYCVINKCLPFVPIEIHTLKEIADKLQELEKDNDSWLNGCIISDDIYEYIEEIEKKRL